MFLAHPPTTHRAVGRGAVTIFMGASSEDRSAHVENNNVRSPAFSDRLRGTISTARSGLRLPPRNIRETRDLQRLRLSDGGTVWLSWWWAPGYSSSPPATVLFCPGLNNSSHLAFVQHAVASLQQRNFTVAVLDYRAVGGSLTSTRLFGADSWRDLSEVVEAVRERNPRSLLLGLGHSMGGSCLVKFASELGKGCPLCAVATVSSPFALSAHTARLESSTSWRFLNMVTASTARLSLLKLWLSDPPSRAFLRPVRWWDVLRATSLRELEAATVCPMNGFADPEDYYAFATADLGLLEVPLLAVHSKDDPVIGVAELPLRTLAAHPHVSLVLTERGGHLGYYGSDEGARMVDGFVGSFLERHRDLRAGMSLVRARL